MLCIKFQNELIHSFGLKFSVAAQSKMFTETLCLKNISFAMVCCSAKNKFFCVKLSSFNKKVLFQWLKKQKQKLMCLALAMAHQSFIWIIHFLSFSCSSSFLFLFSLLQLLSYFFFPTVDEVVVFFFLFNFLPHTSLETQWYKQ